MEVFIINILFLSLGRLDNINSNEIYTDLLRKLRDEGHTIYVVSPLERRLSRPTNYSLEEGVHFLRVKIGNIKNTNIVEKGVTTISIGHIFKRMISKHFNEVNFDLVLYSTPPITFTNIVSYIKKRDNAKTYLLLKDIFPQNAIDLNLMNKKSPIYRYFKTKEKQLYKVSDFIGCMSEENVRYLIENNPGLDRDKVEVSPNTIDPRSINYFDNNDEILRKFNIPKSKIKLLYGGNLGAPQGIDFLVKCIDENRNNNNFHFIISGSGKHSYKIKDYIKKEKPQNLTFINILPKKEYDELVSACDVGLIFLDYRFKIPNFPSRLLAYMEAAKPILAATDKNTDIGNIITDHNFGKWCESKDSNNFNELLPHFNKESKRIEMGNNARHYLEENYTVDNSYDIILNHFK